MNELVEMDVDLVKIRVDDNLGRTTKMSEAVYTAVIDQAHARGLRLAAHLYYLEDAKSLLRAGADLLAHSIRDQDVDEELIDLLNARDVCVCPTLMREVSTFVYESRPAFFDDPFFLRDADPAVLQALEDPARQQTTRESSSAQQYKVAFEVAKRNREEARRRGDQDFVWHRHWPARAVPRLLRAAGAGTHGGRRADADAGVGVGDGQRRRLHASRPGRDPRSRATGPI